jgi:ADP-heptose:LPS heptosyltransferase
VRRGQQMRILIVNMTRLGDQLQTSPTIAGLKERHPDAHITVVGDAHHMEVCHGIPGVDRVYEIDLNRIGHLLLDGGTRLVDAYRYVEGIVHDLRAPGFQLALNFSSSRMSSVFMHLLRIQDCRGWMMDSVGHRLISHRWSQLFVASVLNRRFTPYNLVDFYCRIAGVRPQERRLWYRTTAEGERGAARLLAEARIESGQRVIALQPGASNAIRQWPAAYFARLGRELRDRLGARILLIGGTDDVALSREIAAEIGSDAIVAAGRTDLPTLGALLARATLLVTGDTGPMHLATAVGTPVVAFYFGPAYVWETGPYGADNIAFQTRISCSPCHHAVRCLAPLCREELTPDMVYWAVHDRLAHDYSALARRARDWPRVDVYRTGFDTQGMSDPTPLVPRLDGREVFRLAYREMWRAVLDGEVSEAEAVARVQERWRTCGDEHPVTLDLAPQRHALEVLEMLAGRGEALGRVLMQEAARPTPSLDRLEVLTAEIEGVDAEIERQGHLHEAVGTLVRAFGFAKENLSDTRALAVLSRETTGLYDALGRWAGLTQRLVGAIAGADAGTRVPTVPAVEVDRAVAG